MGILNFIRYRYTLIRGNQPDKNVDLLKMPGKNFREVNSKTKDYIGRGYFTDKRRHLIDEMASTSSLSLEERYVVDEVGTTRVAEDHDDDLYFYFVSYFH